ncbi:MAG TPA: anti-sigma factor [Candidatus Binatus sp.]|nr:anti-sigma factor [Candidatus Binatus sp.]
MHCDVAQELITARLDNELDADERSAIEEHLASCAACRVAAEQEFSLKQHIRGVGQNLTAPPALRQAIARKDASDEVKFIGRFRGWVEIFSWRPGWVVATAVLIAASLIYTRWPAQNIGIAALQSHASIVAGKKVLVRAATPTQLRQELSNAVGDRFRPVALDLSMMKLYPVSGFVQKMAGRDVLVTVYQGAGPAITCFTFLGTEADAPDGAERFYDADMRLNFYTFSRDNFNAILHREGEVICLLVSKMAPADLLALLRGKSAHA